MSKPDAFAGLRFDDELEASRLHHGKIRGLSTLEDAAGGLPLSKR
jgi:hypothetical protein